MIYVLRGLWDLFYEYTGQWWFDTQTPLDLDPLPTVEDEPEDTVPTSDPTKPWWEDESIPLPEPAGSERPVCVSCGDPNFSLESEFCIACRVGLGKGRRA